MTNQVIDLGYTPRDEFVPFHTRKQRWAALVCHRRAGKTVACVADVVASALECTKQDPRYAYVAPLYVQAKDIAWGYLKKFCYNIPNVNFNEAELRVDLPNGARIRLYGGDNYERMRGIYLDGIILDEYGDMPPNAWPEVIRPALSDRQGWAIFIGTPKGKNHFYDVYTAAEEKPDWFTMTLKASETHLIPEDELEDAKSIMLPEQYEQEFECSFQASLVGSYYGKEITKLEVLNRVCNVPYDPILPVYTSWDLGMDDATAIWFVQIHVSEVRVIDYYENSGCGLDHYAKVLDDKDYKYAEHFLPHDVRVKELGTGRSRIETLESLGIDCTVIPSQSVEDGINAARLLVPRCWFDKTATKSGLERLKQYQREYDEKLKIFKNRPRHDYCSHSADAFRYLALGLPDTNIVQERTIYRARGSWMTA